MIVESNPTRAISLPPVGGGLTKDLQKCGYPNCAIKKGQKMNNSNHKENRERYVKT